MNSVSCANSSYNRAGGVMRISSEFRTKVYDECALRCGRAEDRCKSNSPSPNALVHRASEDFLAMR